MYLYNVHACTSTSMCLCLHIMFETCVNNWRKRCVNKEINNFKHAAMLDCYNDVRS